MKWPSRNAICPISSLRRDPLEGEKSAPSRLRDAALTCVRRLNRDPVRNESACHGRLNSSGFQFPYTGAMRWLGIAGLALLLVSVPTAAASAPVPKSAPHPLRTGFLDPTTFTGPNAARSFGRARTAGASIVRIVLFWSNAAPTAPADPAGSKRSRVSLGIHRSTGCRRGSSRTRSGRLYNWLGRVGARRGGRIAQDVAIPT